MQDALEIWTSALSMCDRDAIEGSSVSERELDTHNIFISELTDNPISSLPKNGSCVPVVDIIAAAKSGVIMPSVMLAFGDRTHYLFSILPFLISGDSDLPMKIRGNIKLIYQIEIERISNLYPNSHWVSKKAKLTIKTMTS